MKNNETEQLKMESESYSDLLKNIAPIVEDINHSIDEASEIANKKLVNFTEVGNVAKEKATDLVDSHINYLVKSKKFRTSDFVQTKRENDIFVLTQIITQIEMGSFAVQKLVEEIDAGGVHPRLFEVMSSLQKSNMDLIKHLSQLQNFLVISYSQYQQHHEIQVRESKQRRLEKAESGEFQLLESNVTQNPKDNTLLGSHLSVIESL